MRGAKAWLGIGGVLVIGLVAWGWAGASEPQEKPSDAAIERTRQQVKMLDDVYKTAVVLITDKYVHDEDDFPAGSAAIALFDQISKKGWHDVQLLDVSGEPYDSDNVADDAFEKNAVKQLREGKAYVEQVTEKDGQPVLRAMTAVPVVMEKCIMCHENYRDAPEGAAVGAISYTIPIQ